VEITEEDLVVGCCSSTRPTGWPEHEGHSLGKNAINAPLR
jgi:hypothetical protein